MYIYFRISVIPKITNHVMKILNLKLGYFGEFQGDLGNYLQKKGRLQASKVLRFALDIARHVLLFYENLLADSLKSYIVSFMEILFYVFLVFLG